MKAVKRIFSLLLAAAMIVSVFNSSAAEALAEDTIDVEIFYGFGKEPGTSSLMPGVLDLTNGLIDPGNGYSIKGSASIPYTANAASGKTNVYYHPKQGEVDSVDVYYAGSETPVSLDWTTSSNTHCLKGTFYYDSSNALTVYKSETSVNSAHGTPLVTFAAAAAGNQNAVTTRWRNVADDVVVVFHYNTGHKVHINTGDENAVFASNDIPKYYLTKTANSADIEIGGAEYTDSEGLTVTVTPDAAPTGIFFGIGGHTASLSPQEVGSVRYLASDCTISDTPAEGDILKYDAGVFTFYTINDDISINYSYTNETYTATFMNGGEVFDTAEALSGTPVAQPENKPEKDGYVFDGWYTDPECTAAYDFSTGLSGNITLYAGFVPVHTITFEGAATFIDQGLNISASAWEGRTGGTWDRLGTLTTAGDFVDTASASSSGVQVRVNSDIGTLESLSFEFGGHSVTVAASDLVSNAIYVKNDGTLTTAFDSSVILKYALSGGVAFLRIYQVTSDINVRVAYSGGSDTVRVNADRAGVESFEVSDTDRTVNTAVSGKSFTVPYTELRGVSGESVRAYVTVREPDAAGIKLCLTDGTEVASFAKNEEEETFQIKYTGSVRISYSASKEAYELEFLYLIRDINIVPDMVAYSESEGMSMAAKVGESIAAEFYADIDSETQALYDSFLMKVRLGNGGEKSVSGAMNTDGLWQFEFTDIYSQCMNEKLTGEVYGVKDGAETAIGMGLSGGMSIAGYCDMVADAYHSDETLLRFMANMLQFGSACQKYLDPGTPEDALAITGRNWALSRTTDEAPAAPAEITSVNSVSDGFDGTSGWIRSASLIIGNRISVSFRIAAPNGVSDLTLVINEKNVDLSAMTPADDGTYHVVMDPVGPSQYNMVYTAVLTNPGGTQTVQYSVDSYCERKAEDAEVGDVARAIYNYGYAARNEVHLPRIAFVGDSITYGYGVSSGYGTPDPATESYPAQLAQMMDGKAVIGNFGRSGAFLTPLDADYNYWVESNSKTDRYYPITDEYAQSLTWDPDIVVIMLGTNDFRNLINSSARENFKGYLKNLADTYKELDSVEKVYIATSISIYSNVTGFEVSSGLLQDLQREAAAEGGYEVIDIYEMTKDFMSVAMHYSGDRLHPVPVAYHEMASAFYSFFEGRTYEEGSMGQAPDRVVYLKTGGSMFGDGSTPESALNSLSKAVGMLSETGGTVVLCGDYKIHYSYDMILPYTKKPVTITSSYGDTDYGATLTMTQNLHLNGDYTFENLNICADRTTAAPMFICRYNDVVFGEGLTMEIGEANKGYPGIIAGSYHTSGGCTAQYASFDGECTIDVYSGTYGFFRGGNVRSQATAAFGNVESGAAVTINVHGGSFVNTAGNNLCTATGMNSLSGVCTLNIRGGTFEGPVCALCRPGGNTGEGAYSMTGTVNINITGGTFGDNIRCRQDAATEYTGTVNINISGAPQTPVDENGFTVVTGEHTTLSNSVVFTYTDTSGVTESFAFDKVTPGTSVDGYTATAPKAELISLDDGKSVRMEIGLNAENASGIRLSFDGTTKDYFPTDGTYNDNAGRFRIAMSGGKYLIRFGAIRTDAAVMPVPASEIPVQKAAADVFASGSFTDSAGTTLPYRYYYPEGYDPDGDTLYPVLFYFHGNGTRGSDNVSQISGATHTLVNRVLNYSEKAVIVAAQCPASPNAWILPDTYPGSEGFDRSTISPYLNAVLELYNSFLENAKIDKTRIYIAGLSNGGGACWSVIARSPQTVAGAVIMAGTGDASNAADIAQYYLTTPIWTFHGDADATLDVNGTRGMYAAVTAAGGDLITYTEMPGYGHNIWPDVANRSDVIDWLFAQRRPDSAGVFTRVVE
ncbi:MAG: InlB B-repeat-containing protein [Lachnospiraceae bacterium]|nr:InlB B-repeat-containing protein [Lachnospiraceae bacterium]